ncbi:asparagine synthase (glutamine-hydrolyzing) [Bacillus horti]|uniref:asparagine synthase (glutamine-hydrolyzing) n=1 Tax=Caldalkalibacillus horti TaxID=77523 RepID=A0ABT9VUR1_9BACI|nr:asparagine synthase (glutamine-hydrolyzing) [Bacillus horti]MDQ0164615.1 asparagine synthase (glutamine-hydrolyzing) [Bacillus horti]
MCGITGWIDWSKNISKHHGDVRKMATTLNKRGPDAIGVWSNHHIAFGHTRLAVVDPSGGGQPMIRHKDEYVYTIVYNGELYNTEDLRTELLKCGYTFHSHSDTEVLLKAYMEWGASCLERLNGIFAFAIWDEKEQHLFIARDRLGVKPLFYHEEGGSFIFGSEHKAILANPEVEAKVNLEGLREIFGLGPSRTPGHGIYKGIKELRPAHFLIFSKAGLSIKRYWQLKSKKHQETLEETVEQIRNLLVDSIERQLVADVPVGTFLSGGIDSSAISSIAAREFERNDRGPLHTFSIDYEDNATFFKANDFQPNADPYYINLVSTHLQSNHHSLIIETPLLAQYLTNSVYVRDLPGMADIDSSLLWFCEEIKKHTTVALSGECADEIFGGYPWFHKQELMDRESFPWMDSIKEREGLLQPSWRSKLQLQEYVQQRYEETLQEIPCLEDEEAASARRRELFYLNMVWFMTTLLDRKDRMSMGASLEVRVPFADHRLVEYVWNVPWEMKMVDGMEKGILRRALQGYLPDEVLYRKKSPYPKTHNPIYTEIVGRWLTEIIENTNSPILEFIDKKVVQEIIQTKGTSFKRPWFGQLMTGPQLMAHLCQINTWLDHYNVHIVQ